MKYIPEALFGRKWGFLQVIDLHKTENIYTQIVLIAVFLQISSALVQDIKINISVHSLDPLHLFYKLFMSVQSKSSKMPFCFTVDSMMLPLIWSRKNL